MKDWINVKDYIELNRSEEATKHMKHGKDLERVKTHNVVRGKRRQSLYMLMKP